MKTEVEKEEKNHEKEVNNVNDCDGDQDGDEYGGTVGDEGVKLEGEGGKEGEEGNREEEKIR